MSKQNQPQRVVAILLAFFLGGFGVHRAYIGDTKSFVLMLLFFWTFIPAFIAVIDWIRYALMNEDQWEKYVSQF